MEISKFQMDNIRASSFLYASAKRAFYTLKRYIENEGKAHAGDVRDLEVLEMTLKDYEATIEG